MSTTIAAIESRLDVSESELAFPRMPNESGVEEPQKRPAHRLSDNYYKLEHEEWVPQIIADPAFPGLILQGGKQLSLKQTRQRDEVVTWLLFETGARRPPSGVGVRGGDHRPLAVGAARLDPLTPPLKAELTTVAPVRL